MGSPVLTPGLHDGPRWRVGGTNPHTLYLQLREEPNRSPVDGDPFVGSLLHPDFVKRAVEAVNLVRAGMCGEFDVLHTQLAGVISVRDQLQDRVAHLETENQQLRDALAMQRGAG